MELQIRRIRLEKNIKQVTVAATAGITAKSLSAIETGKQNPRTDTLERIAEALNCEVAEFFAPVSTANRKSKNQVAARR